MTTSRKRPPAALAQRGKNERHVSTVAANLQFLAPDALVIVSAQEPLKMNGNGLLSEAPVQPSAACGLADRAGQSGSGKIDTISVTEPGASARPGAPRLLIVEDDAPLARLLSSWLAGEGFDVAVAHDGEEAFEKLALAPCSLMLLDLNLPGMDGIAMLGRLASEQPQLPVFVLTGRNRTEDLVVTLNGGADDFLVKPFSLVELRARIGALLRRRDGAASRPAPIAAPPQGLTINREEYRVERDGREIELTPREFALLEFLVQHAPRPVSRATLMEQVWHVPFDPSTNIVDVYMKYLRDKIDGTAEKKLIRTVRGVGYAVACA